jgi:hypothetical protein
VRGWWGRSLRGEEDEMGNEGWDESIRDCRGMVVKELEMKSSSCSKSHLYSDVETLRCFYLAHLK